MHSRSNGVAGLLVKRAAVLSLGAVAIGHASLWFAHLSDACECRKHYFTPIAPLFLRGLAMPARISHKAGMDTYANKVIDTLGGTTAVANMMHAPKSTVHSWRTIGIPASRLSHLRLLAKLQRVALPDEAA